jgi:uncharacterized protein YjbI with pentapeptide repeats
MKSSHAIFLPDQVISRQILSGVYLGGAELMQADLSAANLSGADLRMADLSRAHLSETIFGNSNLTDAKGLDTCDHEGPSTVDHRTL